MNGGTPISDVSVKHGSLLFDLDGFTDVVLSTPVRKLTQWQGKLCCCFTTSPIITCCFKSISIIGPKHDQKKSLNFLGKNWQKKPKFKVLYKTLKITYMNQQKTLKESCRWDFTYYYLY